ncbi:TPA: 4Fe-4S binding protein, partial [Vibrio parahaemolyticus]
MDVGKRHFLRTFVRHANQSDSDLRTVPRPPTALDEKHFVQSCTGCGICVSACPNHIITIQHQLAELDLELGYCS